MITRLVCWLLGHKGCETGNLVSHKIIGRKGIHTYRCPRCTRNYERYYRVP